MREGGAVDDEPADVWQPRAGVSTTLMLVSKRQTAFAISMMPATWAVHALHGRIDLSRQVRLALVRRPLPPPPPPNNFGVFGDPQ